MEHKYLEEIGIKISDTPWGWNEDDPRQEYWNKDRQQYGFDERETWSLNTTFFYWLYERLTMYNKVNCIKTDTYSFIINQEKLTQQQCIDRMILGCKYYIKLSHGEPKDEDIAIIIGKEVIEIWKECFYAMWW